MTTYMNGDTGVSKVQDGMIVQADLAANVVGNGPAFRAYMSANQNFTTGSWQALAFNTEVYDTASVYDTGSGKFQPTVAGYYQINVSGYVSNNSGTTSAGIGILKNGALTAGTIIVTAATNLYVASDLVYLNGTTDYVQGGFYSTGSSTGLASALSGGPVISGFLARAA